MKVQEINTLREKLIQLSFSFKFDQNLLDEIISDYKQNFENEYYEEEKKNTHLRIRY